MMLFNSVRARLTGWYATSLALILFAFCTGVYFYLQSGLRTALDVELADSVDIVENGLAAYLDQLGELEEHGALNLFQVREGGTVVYQTRGWRTERLDESAAEMHSAVWTWLSPFDRSFRLNQRDVETAGRMFHVVVAQDRTAVEDGMHRLRWAMLFGFIAALAFSVAGGWALARRALRPVGNMADRARAITADRLSERLPVEQPQDEFGQLADVFNDTFTRLERSFDELRRFTADASHELRTPLAVLRSVGEVGLQKGHSAGQLREVIGSMLEESSRLSRLVDSLLTLSRMESGRARLRVQQLDVTTLARDVVECLRPLAEEKNQAISAPDALVLSVEADPTLLRQALMNLIDNAVKYTPEHGTIKVAVERSGNLAKVLVEDSGPGIAAEHHAQIFDRFYRVDTGRSRETGGTGLGLAIARWIVEQHGGAIAIRSSNTSGTAFEISLPLAIMDRIVPQASSPASIRS